MIKVEPDLPEPTRKPSTFLVIAPDGLFVEGGLLSSCIEIYYSEESIIRCKDIVDAIQEGIIVGDLTPMLMTVISQISIRGHTIDRE